TPVNRRAAPKGVTDGVGPAHRRLWAGPSPEWLKLAAPRPLELHFASVVDAERARLLAIGEDRLEVGQLHIGAMRSDETLDIVAASPAARLADEREGRLADVG